MKVKEHADSWVFTTILQANTWFFANVQFCVVFYCFPLFPYCYIFSYFVYYLRCFEVPKRFIKICEPTYQRADLSRLKGANSPFLHRFVPIQCNSANKYLFLNLIRLSSVWNEDYACILKFYLCSVYEHILMIYLQLLRCSVTFFISFHSSQREIK